MPENKKKFAFAVIFLFMFIPAITFLAGCSEDGGPVVSSPDAEAPEATMREGAFHIDEPFLDAGMPVADIEDATRAPDTVLATVSGAEITLQDLYDRFNELDPHDRQYVQHQQVQLLESLIQTELLVLKAEELGVSEWDSYREKHSSMKDMTEAMGLDGRKLERYALIETLLTAEIFDKAEVDETELEELSGYYRSILGEDVDLEPFRPYLERELMMRHVEAYIMDLHDGADIEIDQEWLDEKQGQGDREWLDEKQGQASCDCCG